MKVRAIIQLVRSLLMTTLPTVYTFPGSSETLWIRGELNDVKSHPCERDRQPFACNSIHIRGPRFVIDPPQPVLHLIAALGPVDVGMRQFQQSAHALLGKPVDEILVTIDALAFNGIFTPRPKPVRVIPDVLSDYILVERCVSPDGQVLATRAASMNILTPTR